MNFLKFTRAFSRWRYLRKTDVINEKLKIKVEDLRSTLVALWNLRKILEMKAIPESIPKAWDIKTLKNFGIFIFLFLDFIGLSIRLVFSFKIWNFWPIWNSLISVWNDLITASGKIRVLTVKNLKILHNLIW